MDNHFMAVIKCAPENEHLPDFQGGALVCPCDVELTRNSTSTARTVFAKAGPDLVKECLAIGYCEIGHTVITKGYGLSSKHVIFLPVVNTNSPGEKINHLTLYQALRNALTLAVAYSVETIAIPVIYLKRTKMGREELQEEFMAILTSVSSENEKTPVKEITLYL